MNEPNTKLELQKAALELRGTTRASWDKFLEALTAYSTHVTTNCVNSPIDVLPVMQGRARMMLEILTDLRNAPAAVEKAKARTPTP